MNTLPEFQQKPLLASECLAIEDAPGGVDAAHGAGIRCMGLAHSRTAENLAHADWTFRGFEEVDLTAIAREFEQ
jgi:beta-phosphoglucomutase-like phosphatase (HAD superfamily)